MAGMRNWMTSARPTLELQEGFDWWIIGALPMADEYVAAVGEWLSSSDLTGAAEPPESVPLPPACSPISVVRPVRLPFEHQ
jgi:hypothetical protein